MSNPVKPTADHIGQHLRHLFDRLPEKYQNYEIEIACSAREGRKVNVARHFPISNINAAVEYAVGINLLNGRNIYVGAALRKPGRGERRSGTDDVAALTALFVDIDDKIASANAVQIYQKRPPTAIVITGHVPHLRQQLWWRLEEPLLDLNAGARYLENMVAKFGGDPNAKDVGRLMRLGGSIAWPKKQGREIELTEFILRDETSNV